MQSRRKAVGFAASLPVEHETLVLDVMEQMAPLLIKTMAAVMGHQMSNMKQLLDMKDKRISALEDRLDVLEADKLKQYSRHSNLKFQGIHESENETTKLMNACYRQ